MWPASERPARRAARRAPVAASQGQTDFLNCLRGAVVWECLRFERLDVSTCKLCERRHLIGHERARLAGPGGGDDKAHIQDGAPIPEDDGLLDAIEDLPDEAIMPSGLICEGLLIARLWVEARDRKSWPPASGWSMSWPAVMRSPTTFLERISSSSSGRICGACWSGC